MSVLKHWIRPFSLSATHNWSKWGTRARLWGTLSWPGLGVLPEDSTEQRKVAHTRFMESFKVWCHSCVSFQIHENKPFTTDFTWGKPNPCLFFGFMDSEFWLETKIGGGYLLPTGWWTFRLVKTAQSDCCSNHLPQRCLLCWGPQPHQWAGRSDSGHSLAACSFPELREGLLCYVGPVWTPFLKQERKLNLLFLIIVHTHTLIWTGN